MTEGKSQNEESNSQTTIDQTNGTEEKVDILYFCVHCEAVVSHPSDVKKSDILFFY